MTAVQNLTDAT